MRIVHKALGFGLLIGLAACVLQAGTPRSIQLATRPLAFEENRGQTDGRVRFLSRGEGYSLFLTPVEAVLALRGGDPARVLRLRWEGAAPAPRVSGEGELPGKSHYLMGSDPAKWRRGIPSYQKVQYKGIYPGIDLVFYGNPRQLEYDFVLAPGADPKTVRLAVEGADRMEIDPAGDLVLHLDEGEVRLKRPVSYQQTGDTRREVASAFRRIGDGRIGFTVGEHDPTRPLVIDPVLVFSTYLGGSREDSVFDVKLDPAGNVYLAGYSVSPDFPVPHGPGPSIGAFLMKMTPEGTPVYVTYLGARASYGVALDPAGNIYLTGLVTGPAGLELPLVNPLPPDQRGNGEWDAFVAKLDPSGSTLLYSTTLGGPGQEEGRSIAVDAQGHAYVTGGTHSGFPIVAPPLPPTAEPRGFLAKLHPSGSSLVYSTTFDGYGFEVATDPAGNLYWAGIAWPGLPTVNAWLPSPLGSDDGFVGKLTSSGSPVYLTRIGGSRSDQAWSVAADAAGNAYVTGHTNSPDFPLLQPFQSEFRSFEVFVTKLGPAGAPVYSTYLGGADSDGGQSIAVDGTGSAHVTGWTQSADFPLKDPVQSACSPLFSRTYCQPNVFVTKLNPQGSSLGYSTYLGGSDTEEGLGIAADNRGNTYIVGFTYSDDFPTVQAFQPFFGGGFADAFIARISTNRPPDCSAAFTTPATLWPPNGKLVPVSIRGVTDPDGDPVTLRVTGVRQDEPLSRQGTPDTLGIGTSAVQLRSDRAGGGDGRVYRVTFEASDGNGGVCTGAVTVCVPRDQGRGRTCGDGGPLFPSGG